MFDQKQIILGNSNQCVWQKSNQWNLTSLEFSDLSSEDDPNSSTFWYSMIWDISLEVFERNYYQDERAIVQAFTEVPMQIDFTET